MFEFLRLKKTVEQPQIEQPKKEFTQLSNIPRLNINSTDPYVSEIKTGYGFSFGEKNLYPQQLCRFFSQSPAHSACLTYKHQVLTVDGLQVDTTNLDNMTKIIIQQFKYQIDEAYSSIVMDLLIHNRFYLKIHWNNDNTKIIKLEHISAEKVRIYSVDENMEPTEYNVCYDWRMVGRFPPVQYRRFDKSNTKDKCQIFEYQGPTVGKKLYPLPSYRSCLDWAYLDGQMGVYHNASITNSLNPSLLVQFYQQPDTDEKKREVLSNLVDNFAGAQNAGRAFVSFAPDKDGAPTITQMESTKLDKGFLALTDTITRQILFAHSIHPELLGLAVPGSLGQTSDRIAELKDQFNKTVIKPLVYQLERQINYLASFNGITTPITIKPSI